MNLLNLLNLLNLNNLLLFDKTQSTNYLTLYV